MAHFQILLRISFLLFLSTPLSAQLKVILSPKEIAQKQKEANQLLQNALQLYAGNPKSALNYAEKSESIFSEINYTYGLAQSRSLLAKLHLYQLARPDKAAGYHEKAFDSYLTLYKNKKISKEQVNVFLKNDVIKAYELVSADPNLNRKDKKAIKRYEDLYKSAGAFLGEIVADQQSQLNVSKLSEKKLAYEKLQLKGNLTAKEMEALALVDSLYNRELELKNQALKLTEEKAKTDKLLQEKALKESEALRQRIFSYALLAVLVLGLALIIFVYINFHNQKKANQLLQLKNTEINQQKEEIADQRDNLEELNNELHQQKEEIATQRDNLETLNQELHQQKEEVSSQRDALKELNEQIIIQRNQSDQLLINILPEEVAQELKTTGKTKPKYYEQVSVLFTDFKGFTKLAERLTPEEIVLELDNCFLAFDEIIEKFEMEKIKTIGDAYMCAGGLPVSNKTNPIDAVRAGLAMQEFMQKMNEDRTKVGKDIWELRIGIHTGPLVAGVIGKHKFAYDIWGDTVNLAARMEASGEEGKVNISGETYLYVKDYFQCEYRGKIMAKNKGVVDMYFVSDQKL